MIFASKSSTGEDCDEVERLALRDALHHVEENNVAEVLQPGEESECAADLAGSDQSDLLACHGRKNPAGGMRSRNIGRGTA